MGAGIIIICIIIAIGTIWDSVSVRKRLNDVQNDNINIRRANEYIRVDLDREVVTKELAFKELLSARTSKDLIIEEYETRIGEILASKDEIEKEYLKELKLKVSAVILNGKLYNEIKEIHEETETRIKTIFKTVRKKKHAIAFGEWLKVNIVEDWAEHGYDQGKTIMEMYVRFANETLKMTTTQSKDNFYIASYDKDNTRLEEIKTANDNSQTIHVNMISTEWQEELYQKVNR